MAALCGLDGTGALLDLGCGPGQLAAAFRPHMAAALGMDPEPEMLDLARRMAPGIEFRHGSSADLAPGLGPFRLVTIGRAFHWMDRAETARRLDGLIEPGGALTLFRTDHPDLPDNAWRAGFRQVVDAAVIGGQRAAWRQPGWVPHEAVLLDSAFSDLRRLSVLERRRTPAGALVDRALSMSSTSRARLGEAGVAALVAAVTATLPPDGMVTEVVESTALIARRPAGA